MEANGEKQAGDIMTNEADILIPVQASAERLVEKINEHYAMNEQALRANGRIGDGYSDLYRRARPMAALI